MHRFNSPHLEITKTITRRRRFPLLEVIILCLGFIWGGLAIKYHIPPFKFFAFIYRELKPYDNLTQEISASPETLKRSFQNLPEKRDLLKIRLIPPPSLLKLTTMRDSGIDFISISLYGIKSQALLYHATSSSRACLKIYVHGHDGNPLSKTHINTLRTSYLNNGCDFLVMSMLGVGMNEGPSSFPTRFGEQHLSSEQAAAHGNYSTFYDKDNPQLDGLSLFIAPHYHIISQVAKNYTKLELIGSSGGGWYAIFLASLIPEISSTISNAGSIPHEYRKFRHNHGDWEQIYSKLYEEISYWDLYVLSVVDEDFELNRRLYLLYNSKDRCCFGNPYALHLKEIIDALKIHNFRVIINETTNHDLDVGLALRLGN
jgi:hypothetical protein